MPQTVVLVNAGSNPVFHPLTPYIYYTVYFFTRIKEIIVKFFKVEKMELPNYIQCDYCKGVGYKEFEFYEEFKKENTKMTYLCPSCGGAKSVKTDEVIISYVPFEIEIERTQTINVDGEDKEFYAQEVDQIDFYNTDVGSKLLIGDKYYNLIDKEKEGDEFFLFSEKEEAENFIESVKEKIIP
jgi:Zn finger protein HypA/HybF involved in hydrogenase expression